MTDRISRLLAVLMIVSGLGAIAISCNAAHATTQAVVELQAVPDAPPAPVIAMPDPGADAGGFAAALLEAGRARNYRALGALLLMGAVYLLRRFGAKLFAPLGTDRGGAIAALLAGVVGAYSTALAAGAALTWSLAFDGLVMGATAAGGWVMIKRILWPKDTAAAA